MSESRDSLAMESDGADSGIDDLIESLTARVQAGQPVEIDEVIRLYPEHAERLGRLLPALVMMADLGESSPRELEGVVASGASPAPGVLGDFRIIREVGRGGMGVVYEAEQLSLDRRVALKVLPLGAAMDAKQLQRFQLEAHAAACLHHTNIVPVHAVGCERGVPYYAMQFIEGRSLAQLIAELRRLEGLDATGGPPADLADITTATLAASLADGRLADRAGRPTDRGATAPPSERPGGAGPAAGTRPPSCSSTRHRDYVRSVSRLGVQVAEALDHAHTRGILHRDIKPANLLLDEQGQLWVTDFGLAQIQGSPCLTLTGDILGTLRYMSPEQALARRVVIDGRTDIYSLGVTVYELLTLRPAVDGADRAEILRKISQEEPAAPRRLNPAIPRDLETIVLKAMAKEPAGRYATAKELGDDLRRFLEDRPIKARRPSPWDRVAKWTRRHRPLVASVAAAAVLFLILAVLVLGSSNLRIQEEQRRADEQKGRAEANLRKAREVVDRMLTRVAQGLAHTPRMEKVRRALLVDALEFYQQFLRENGTDTGLRFETARAYIKFGEIHQMLGQYGRAEEAWRPAIALLQALSSEFPRVPEYREDLAYCRGELGLGLSHRRRYQEGLAERVKEIEIREGLVSDFPAVADYRRRLALAHTDAGNGYGLAGMVQEAEQHHRHALGHWERLRAEFPGRPEDRRGLAHIHQSWGELLLDTNRLPEAEEELGEAVTALERLLAEDPANDDLKSLLAYTQGNLGQVLLQRGKVTEAEALFRRSIRLYEDLMRDFPDTPLHLRRLCVIYRYLSQSLREMRRFDEAISMVRQAIELRERLAAGSGDPDDRPVWGGDMEEALACLYLEAGREREAADAFRLARAHYERGVTEHPGVAWLQVEYARFLGTCPIVRLRDTDRAIELARQALRLSPDSREGRKVLGVIECRAGRWAAAIEVMEAWAAMDLNGDPEVGFSLAIAHVRVGRTREARVWYERAVGWMDRRRLRDDGLSRLRAEAASLLGLHEPAPSARKEVPGPAKG